MIIAISGKAGSGKDTFARALAGNRSVAVKSMAFADPLKVFVQQLYPGVFTESDLWGPSENRNKIEPTTGKPLRVILQELGTKWREFDPDIWVRPAILKANKMLMSGQLGLGLDYSPQKGVYYYGALVSCDVVCVTDCRFENELAHLKRAGAMTIRMKRKGSGLKSERAGHVSETSLDQVPDEHFHAIVHNKGEDEDELKNVVQTVLRDAKILWEARTEE
jgi:hypothetical protein